MECLIFGTLLGPSLDQVGTSRESRVEQKEIVAIIMPTKTFSLNIFWVEQISLLLISWLSEHEEEEIITYLKLGTCHIHMKVARPTIEQWYQNTNNN